jgi:F0F1-type ATP synthase membrane subunit b/b'
MSPITLALESVLAIMLGACLFYFWRLDRKLNALRTGQDGIRAAATELVQATTQAEAAVRSLKLTAAEAGRDLQARINDARATADRLGLGAGRMRSSGDLSARTRL